MCIHISSSSPKGLYFHQNFFQTGDNLLDSINDKKYHYRVKIQNERM